jgi:hypothetical protein
MISRAAHAPAGMRTVIQLAAPVRRFIPLSTTVKAVRTAMSRTRTAIGPAPSIKIVVETQSR